MSILENEIVIAGLNYHKNTDPDLIDIVKRYTEELRKDPRLMSIRPTTAVRDYLMTHLPQETEKMKEERLARLKQ